MTSDDKPRFSALMFWLAQRMLTRDGRPQPVDEAMLADWFDVLRSIRIERLEWGARHLFATTRWFPMPVDLHDAAMSAPSSVLPALAAPHRAQLAESSVLSQEEAKAALARLVEGLDDWQTGAEGAASDVAGLVKPVSGAAMSRRDVEQRMQMLRDQAQVLVAGGAP